VAGANDCGRLPFDEIPERLAIPRQDCTDSGTLVGVPLLEAIRDRLRRRSVLDAVSDAGECARDRLARGSVMAAAVMAGVIRATAVVARVVGAAAAVVGAAPAVVALIVRGLSWLRGLGRLRGLRRLGPRRRWLG